MFEEAGITAPPQNPDELLAMAQKLTTADHAGFCVRGDNGQVLYDAFQLWQWFYPWNNPITGNYFDTRTGTSSCGQEPQASAFGDVVPDAAPDGSPEGIATYKVTDCLQDFQQGRVAMWHDDSGTIPEVLDPEKSTVADSVAFWSLPCPAINPDHCDLVQPFGTWINAASKNKEAAWQLVQFLTSKDDPGRAPHRPGALLTPSRLSVLAGPGDDRGAAEDVPRGPDRHPQPSQRGAAAVHPRGRGHHPADRERAVRSSSRATVRSPDVMKKMTDGVNAIMTAAGYPKPFPKY